MRLTVVVPAESSRALHEKMGREDVQFRHERARRMIDLVSAGLSATGSPPATHYVASGDYTEAQIRFLEARFGADAIVDKSDAPLAFLASLGLKHLNDLEDDRAR